MSRRTVSVDQDKMQQQKQKTEHEPGTYGCLFCRSGVEERIISELKILLPNIQALSPKKIRIRRFANEAVEEIVSLFPGYIFFATSTEIDFNIALRKQDIYRLLTYPNGQWELHGPDKLIAEIIFANGGVLGLSKAYYEGDKVCIVEGPLKDYVGSIIKINKRAKTAQVKISLYDKDVILWLGYEVIDPVR